METSAVLDTEALIDARAVGGLQRLVGVLGACALFVEGFDTQVMTYLAPQISRLWHLSSSMLGSILSADLLGLLIGYLALAPFSARFGHRRMVTACSTAFGALTFLTASAPNVSLLILARILTGIGVGGAMPSAVALTAEYFPERWRSSSITMMYVGISLGQIAAGTVAGALLAPFGWRPVLMAGGAITLVFSLLFFAALPESLEYLINRGNGPGKDRTRALAILRRLAPDLEIGDSVRLVSGNGRRQRVKIGQLFADGRAAGTALLWIGMFANLMIFYLLAKWLTQLLVQVGLSQAIAINATEISLGGGIIAAFVIGPLMDRLGPYTVVVGLFAASALAVMVMASVLTAGAPLPIMAAALIVGFCLSGGQKATNALAVYFYPTALRGAGLGWALGMGRAGGYLGPILAGIVLNQGWSPAGLFYAAAAPMAAGAVAITVMARLYGSGAAAPSISHVKI